MNDRHVIVGAGPVGRHVAKLLADRGSEVSVLTRSGTSTGIDGVEHLTVDASDPEALTSAAERAAVLYNCASPANYTSWARVLPPLGASFLAAAERSGAASKRTAISAGNCPPSRRANAPGSSVQRTSHIHSPTCSMLHVP